MRALSVKQPWAELIARGEKTIEQRSWADHRFGELLIVSSSTHGNDGVCVDEGFDPNTLLYGVAMCVVDFWQLTRKGGEYEWHLRNVRVVDPVSVQGRAAIYYVDDTRIRPNTTIPRPPRVRRTPLPLSARTTGEVVVATRNARLRDVWTTALTEHGYSTTVHATGNHALAALKPTTRGVLIDGELQGLPARLMMSTIRDRNILSNVAIVVVGGARLDRSFGTSWVKANTSSFDVARELRAMSEEIARG